MNIFGRSLDSTGISMISLHKERKMNNAQDYGVLIRTKEEEQLICLKHISEISALTDTLKDFTKVNFTTSAGKEVSSVLVASEERLIVPQLKFNIIYVRDGQYTLPQMMQNCMYFY
jgi:hypothetical protein